MHIESAGTGEFTEQEPSELPNRINVEAETNIYRLLKQAHEALQALLHFTVLNETCWSSTGASERSFEHL